MSFLPGLDYLPTFPRMGSSLSVGRPPTRKKVGGIVVHLHGEGFRRYFHFSRAYTCVRRESKKVSSAEM